MSYASMLAQVSNEKILTQLRWHLENSGDEPNAAIERFWTAYYHMVGQLDQAIRILSEPPNSIPPS